MTKPQLTAEQQLRVNELKQMSPQEWETVCKGCGVCCLCKTTIRFTPTMQQTFFMDLCCNYLDIKSKKCTIYPNRLKIRQGRCRKVDINLILNSDLLPPTCGYIEYIYGPAPQPINVDFNKIRPVGNTDLDNPAELVPHLIRESANWKHR